MVTQCCLLAASTGETHFHGHGASVSFSLVMACWYMTVSMLLVANAITVATTCKISNFTSQFMYGSLTFTIPVRPASATSAASAKITRNRYRNQRTIVIAPPSETAPSSDIRSGGRLGTRSQRGGRHPPSDQPVMRERLPSLSV